MEAALVLLILWLFPTTMMVFVGGAVINGDYYDNWNSADEVPLYFYTKE